ncbi:MAG: hypothetical protein K2L14_08580 [Duncaniella sp.]|nr:hypothetical protein [Duncaniella sp.]
MSETVETPPATESADSPATSSPPADAGAADSLGTFELLRAPGSSDEQIASSPDEDVTASVLSRPRRSVWD